MCDIYVTPPMTYMSYPHDKNVIPPSMVFLI